MKKIYCISGLGADERAFSKLQIEGYQLQVIKWLMPEGDEPIEQYATRMRRWIDEDNPILMGLSFGGMVCIEIAKQIPVQRIILISSIKVCTELPFWLKAVARLKLHKLVPLKSSKLTQPIQNRMLGVTSPEEKKLVASLRQAADLQYTNWAVHQAINWKNNWLHPHIFHVHGTSDNMFPIRYVKPNHILKQAGHFMIMNRAGEVSSCINTYLKNV